MIDMANLNAKPVITATQMLESMVSMPRPTRAEASDVANAVLDGSDCVMLSGETANGKYPVNAVKVMSKICFEAERILDYKKIFSIISNTIKPRTDRELLAQLCVQSSIDTDASLIICFTETGQMARQVSMYRPKARIIVCTDKMDIVRNANLLRSALGYYVPTFSGREVLLKRTIMVFKEQGLCKSGDKVIAIYGTHEMHPELSNIMNILDVP